MINSNETTNTHWYNNTESKAMAQAYVSEYDNAPDDDSDTMYFMSERARWGRAVLENNWELADKIQASWDDHLNEENWEDSDYLKSVESHTSYEG